MLFIVKKIFLTALSNKSIRNPYNDSWSNKTTLSKTWSGLTALDGNNNNDITGTKDFWGWSLYVFLMTIIIVFY